VREAFGDLWLLEADAVCITTNGTRTRAGLGVMGRGCAAQAKRMIPGIDRALGDALFLSGNRVQTLVWANVPEDRPLRYQVPIVAFPVKHDWHQAADLELIGRSCCQLMDLAGREGWSAVLLPRPGCGNGRLRWAQVQAVIKPILDDRVVVVARPEEAGDA
jgi:hypothetical protein